MPRLIVESGPLAGTEYVFDRPVVIGRDQTADFALGHQAVSRQHAMLRWTDNQCYIVDLDSANGTFVNGRRVTKPTALAERDLVVLGTVRVRYEQDADLQADQEPATAVTWLDRPVTPTATHALPSPHVPPRPRTLVPSDTPQAPPGDARLLRFLGQFARISTRQFDVPAIVGFLVDGLLELLPAAQRVSVLLARPDSAELTHAASRSREGTVPETTLSRSLVQQVVERREGTLAEPESHDGESVLCAPVVFDDRVFGVVYVEGGTRPTRFTEADLALLVAATSHVGLAVAYTHLQAQAVAREVSEHDMAIAEKVQQHFLPQQLPVIPAFAFDVDFDPAGGVGGDFYDVIRLAPELWCLAIGDVCGKGVSAALYAAKVGSDLRYLALGETSPSSILSRVNRALCDAGPDGMFVTMAIATLDTESCRLLVASAGHPWPLRRNAAGLVDALGQLSDPPLGVGPDTVYHQGVFTLDPGDTLAFYTDGVSEALNPREEMFEATRLAAAMAESNGTASGLSQHVWQVLRAFVDGAPQSDDQTLLCVQYRP